MTRTRSRRCTFNYGFQTVSSKFLCMINLMTAFLMWHISVKQCDCSLITSLHFSSRLIVVENLLSCSTGVAIDVFLFFFKLLRSYTSTSPEQTGEFGFLPDCIKFLMQSTLARTFLVVRYTLTIQRQRQANTVPANKINSQPRPINCDIYVLILARCTFLGEEKSQVDSV